MTSSGDFTNTFAKELETLVASDDLKLFCSAAALFYWDDKHVLGTRIEATQIMAEFADNVEFGRDPEGLLFYNAPGDLAVDPAEEAHYRIHLNTETTKAIRIDFFWKDPDVEANKSLKPFAKFLTNDTASVSKDTMSHLDKHKGKGKWQKLSLAICSAVLSKKYEDVTVKLTVKSVKKDVTFDVPVAGANASEADKKKAAALAAVRISNAPGVLHFASIDDLGNGKKCVASYDSDRVLYYDKDNRKKLVGVFLPSSGPLPSAFDNHGDQNPPVAVWSNE